MIFHTSHPSIRRSNGCSFYPIECVICCTVELIDIRRMPVLKLSSANQNLELYYEINGEGETKILFIMGLLTEGTAWYRQVID